MTGKVSPLNVPYPEQKPDQVTSYDTSQLWTNAGYAGTRWNPDDLVGKRGLGIYATMLVDEQVKAVCEFKLSAILARGFQFSFDEDSELAEEEQKVRIAVFNKMIKAMRGSFADNLDSIASGREFGFSVTEKVYGTIKYQGRTYKCINQLLTRDPCTFIFITDDYGTLTEVRQKTKSGKETVLDSDTLIHYVNRPKWDQIYGRSDLRAAYRSWYSKDQLIKMWLLFIERYGGGIAVASRTGDSAPRAGTTEYTQLQTALANMGSNKSVILPKDVEVEVHLLTTTDQYEKACTWHDLAIAKALLVPNLLGLSHTGQTGAFAQSQTQFEAFMWTLKNDADRFEETLNEQLWRDLGDQNWGDSDYPVFKFKPGSLEYAKWVLESWKALLGAKAVQATEEDERFLRALLEMPVRDDQSTLLVDPMEERKLKIEEQQAKQPQVVAEPGAKAANDAAIAASIAQQFDDLRTTITTLLSAQSQQSGATVHVHAAPHEPVQLTGVEDDERIQVEISGPVVCSVTAIQRAAQRVAFAVIDRRTTDAESFAVSDLATSIARAVKRVLGDDDVIHQLLDNDTSDVATLQFNTVDMGRLKSSCRSLLDRAWSLGQQHASAEIQKARGEATPQAQLTVKLASLRNKAAAYFDTQSFRMAGDTADQTRRVIQQELQNGIKFSTPVVDVRSNIWDRLTSKGLITRDAVRGVETDDAVNNALDALWQDTEESAAAYLNTLVRTNTFEALNEARFAEFQDPDLKDFVVGLQYAAVMDSSTTEICSHLDDRIYNADNEVWDTYRPPNHFNCRSILMPITTLDDWDGAESPLPDVEPQEGFK